MFKIIKDMKEEIKTLRTKFGKKEQEGSNQNHIKILDRKITLIKIYNSMVTLMSINPAEENYFTGKLIRGNFSERSTER